MALFWGLFRKKPKFKKYNWTHIVIHHSYTKDGVLADWQAIRRYHRDTKKWDYIGYHFGVEKIGDHHEILVGRPLNMNGAHTSQKGMNKKGIGICVVGNFDAEPVPQGALESLALIVQGLMMVYGIPVDKVVRHSDYASYKSCPGKRFGLEAFKKTYLKK